MMYLILLNKFIKNVLAFDIKENRLLFVNKSQQLYLNNDLIDQDVELSSYTFFLNKAWYNKGLDTLVENQKLENKVIVPNTENYKSKSILLSGDYVMDYPKWLCNYFVFYPNENYFKKVFSYSTLYYLMRSNNEFYLSNKISINKFLESNSDMVWNFNLESLGQYSDSIGTFIDENGELKNYEVNKFLGRYDDEVLVALNGEMIIALDTQTGLVSRKWQRKKVLKPSDNPDYPTWVTDYPVWQMIEANSFPPNYNWVSNKNPGSRSFQLDILSQMLYSLFDEYWVAINLKTGESTFQSLKETLDRNHIKRFRASSGYGEDRNYVYTIGEMDEKFFNTDYIPQCLVAVNKETKEIDWVYRFENDGINTDIPQVTEDKVYQLTSGKNLYIFDKSEIQ